jgi:hypothetical protein
MYSKNPPESSQFLALKKPREECKIPPNHRNYESRVSYPSRSSRNSFGSIRKFFRILITSMRHGEDNTCTETAQCPSYKNPLVQNKSFTYDGLFLCLSTSLSTDVATERAHIPKNNVSYMRLTQTSCKIKNIHTIKQANKRTPTHESKVSGQTS